jgi:transcriptional regulator with XRE-family HTH domain
LARIYGGTIVAGKIIPPRKEFQRIRTRGGMSLAEVAEHVGVDASAIWRWENNDRTPLHGFTVDQWHKGLALALLDAEKRYEKLLLTVRRLRREMKQREKKR